MAHNRERSWHEFEHYLEQDLEWPSSDGQAKLIAEMVPAYALSAYRVLLDSANYASRPWAGLIPLAVGLRRQALGHPDGHAEGYDPIARTPFGHYEQPGHVPASFVFEALEHFEDEQAQRDQHNLGEMHPVDRATLIQKHINRRLKEDS